MTTSSSARVSSKDASLTVRLAAGPERCMTISWRVLVSVSVSVAVMVAVMAVGLFYILRTIEL